MDGVFVRLRRTPTLNPSPQGGGKPGRARHDPLPLAGRVRGGGGRARVPSIGDWPVPAARDAPARVATTPNPLPLPILSLSKGGGEARALGLSWRRTCLSVAALHPKPGYVKERGKRGALSEPLNFFLGASNAPRRSLSRQLADHSGSPSFPAAPNWGLCRAGREALAASPQCRQRCHPALPAPPACRGPSGLRVPSPKGEVSAALPNTRCASGSRKSDGEDCTGGLGRGEYFPAKKVGEIIPKRGKPMGWWGRKNLCRHILSPRRQGTAG